MVSQGKGGSAFERVPTSMKTTECKFWLAGYYSVYWVVRTLPDKSQSPNTTFFLLWLADYWNSKPKTSWKGDGNLPCSLCLHSSGFAHSIIHKIVCPAPTLDNITTVCSNRDHLRDLSIWPTVSVVWMADSPWWRSGPLKYRPYMCKSSKLFGVCLSSVAGGICLLSNSRINKDMNVSWIFYMRG